MNSPLRIAIADDELDMREYLQEVLPRLGHAVAAVAENGRQLVSSCRETRPDLVITDIRMPDLDGIETARLVNQDKQTPVLLVSAHHEAELLNRVGADQLIMGYLVKPVSEANLKTAITVAMVRYQHFQALSREASDLRQALEDRKVIERAKGILMRRLRVDEDEAFRRLRKLATDQNLKLVEVGRRVLASETIFAQLDKT
jgi:response regulator NasT